MKLRISSFGLGAVWMLCFLGAALGGAIGNTISVVLVHRRFDPVPDIALSVVVSVLLASVGTVVVRFLFRRLDRVPNGGPNAPTAR